MKKADIRKKLIKECDKLWQQLVIARDNGCCRYCGKTKHVQAHHVITRAVNTLRWHEGNGVALCSGHHTLLSSFSAHKTPLEFLEWLGMEKYIKLKTMKNNRFKTSVANLELLKTYLVDSLMAKLKQMKS